MRQKIRLFLSCILGTLTFQTPLVAAEDADSAVSPSLVVIVVIDQLGSSSLKEHKDLFQGGLKELLDEGVYFPTTSHNYATTETCVGHATIATGTYPKQHGIVANVYRHEGEEKVSACVVGANGYSPSQLRRSALPDWIRSQYPKARLWSVSGKARSSIMLGGLHGARAGWYDSLTGAFASSPFYSQEAMQLLSDIGGTSFVAQYQGWKWSALPKTTELIKRGAVFNIKRDPSMSPAPFLLGETLPHNGREFRRQYYKSPALDEGTIKIARTLVEREQLGKHPGIDFLGISLSSLDVISHVLGPQSPEAIDTLLRADRLLEELFSFIYDFVGERRVIIALTGDHGVTPLTRWEAEKKIDSVRLSVEERECPERIRKEICKENQLEVISNSLYFNDTELSRRGLSRVEIFKEFQKRALRCPHVARIDSTNPPPDDTSVISQRIRNLSAPPRTPDILVIYKPFTLSSTDPGSEHVAPYDYDTDVPLIIKAPGIQPRAISEPIEAINIAPTIAKLVDIEPPEGTGRAINLSKKATDELFFPLKNSPQRQR